MPPLTGLAATMWLIGLSAALAATLSAQEPVRIEGRIVSPDGKPIASARVAVAARYDLDTPQLLATGSRTDANGGFVIAERAPVDAGEIRYLYVAAPGRAAVRRRIEWQSPLIGDISLPTGKRLLGRVRHPDGTPLADARVVATDLLETTRTLRTGTKHGFHCSTRTDAAGIFQLPCALPNAMSLEFSKPGFARTWREPVAIGAPLEVELAATGWIAGRVLDAEGHSVANATVRVDYELRAVEQTVETGADGSFRVPVDREGRWRITARHADDNSTRTARTAVHRGAQANLEILLEPAPGPTSGFLRVRAETASGEAVTDFRAAAVWEEFANRNVAFREFRLRQRITKARPAKDGIAELAGPPPRGSKSGCVRVIATGFAPGTIESHDWHDPEPGEAGEPLVVTLHPEARVRGVVRDSESGEPIANARVRARLAPKTARSQYPDRSPTDGVTTGADGSFELRGLGDGRWRLVVEHKAHAPARPVFVDLTNGEEREGVILELPPGAKVRGRITGMQLGSGAQALLAPLPRTTYSAPGRRVARSTQSRRELPLQAGEEFEFDGVPLGNYQLVLRLPSRPRLGGDLFLPIEPFRVRAAGLDREFDCRADRPGRITGRLSFSHATARPENLIVIAEPATMEQPPQTSNMQFRGPRSFVGRDFRFDIRVGPGDYFLYVADLETTVTLHAESERIEIGTGKKVTRDLSLELARIDLTLAAAPGVDNPAEVDRIEFRFAPRRLPDAATNLGANPNYDSQRGMYWLSGAERRSIVLPPGTAILYARNGARRLRTGQQRYSVAPLGLTDLEIETGSEVPIDALLQLDSAPEILTGEPEVAEIGDADGVDRDK